MKPSATQHRPGRGGATPIVRCKRLSPCASSCTCLLSVTNNDAYGGDKEEALLRTSIIPVLIILALALVVWAFFYVMTPGAPLTFRETTVIVGVCAAVIFSLRAVRKYLNKNRNGHGP